MTIRRIATSALALGVLFASSAGAQTDPRWRAWTGCWALSPDQVQLGAKSTVCVVPTDKPSAVEILTIVGNQVTDRTRVDADGAPHSVSRDGCTTTETAHWAASGTRVHIVESTECTGTPARRGTGVMSFTQQYEWLDVRGINAGGSVGVAAVRYGLMSDTTGLPAEARAAIASRGTAANNATLAASAPLTLADIADVATSADSGVAATWLMERTRGVKLSLNAKQLTALADQGTPASVIDVLVAVSHPNVFALNTSASAPQMREQPTRSGTLAYDNSYWGRYPSYYGSYYSPFYDPYFSMYGGFSSYDYRYRYGYNPYGGYNPYYGYGGYYPGSQPIIVVNRPSGETSTSQHGRVVKGRGYTSSGSSGSNSGGSTGTPRTSTSSGSSSASSGSGSTTPASSGSSSGSSGGDRVAVKKPPQ